MRARGLSAKRWGERGQALAEFALILPLMLLFIAGIVELGRAWNIKQVVTDAAREGARNAVLQNESTWPSVRAQIEERLDFANVEGASITHAGNWHVPGDSMTVRVAVDFRMGLIGVLVGDLSVVSISSEATMRNE